MLWRDRRFDSVLEANWAASLTAWGVDWVHHPGSIQLSDGREWQPDFLLKNANNHGADILLEVKGDHNHRIDKPWLAQADHPDLIILVGRAPHYVSGRSDGGAVWEPSDFEWDLNNTGTYYVSAEHADSSKPGLVFYKALDNTRKFY